MELIARSWVLLGAALTFGLGLLYAANPERIEQVAGIVLPTAAALTEVRSTYGGLHIGIGLFLFSCSRTSRGQRYGLRLCGVVFLFAGLARIVGILQFGAGFSQLGISALELGFSAGAFWLGHRMTAARQGLAAEKVEPRAST